jgi:hypothetical protein
MGDLPDKQPVLVTEMGDSPAKRQLPDWGG